LTSSAIAVVSFPASSRFSTLCLRLVRLEVGAAGAELDRLRAGVFEPGAGVGVNELAGLDPLEAVPF
jgi:hypothetical protein